MSRDALFQHHKQISAKAFDVCRPYKPSSLLPTDLVIYNIAWQTKISYKEDSAQGSSSFTNSSSKESEDETLRSIQPYSSDEDMVPYTDNPLADSEWTAEYKKEIKENEELEKELKQ